MKDGTYQPQPVKRGDIPKPDGSKRYLGIPCVLDRVVQQAILQVILTFQKIVLDFGKVDMPTKLSNQQNIITTRAIKELEEIIDCKDFISNHYDLSKYHLKKVNMNLWKKILKFSREHDYEKGSSKWHIFDASGNNMLKVYIKEDNEEYNEGHKCIIHSN